MSKIVLWQSASFYICLPFDEEGAQLGCNGTEDIKFATMTAIKFTAVSDQLILRLRQSAITVYCCKGAM